VRCLDRAGDGTVLFAELTTRLIAVQESFPDTGVTDDCVAQVTRDSFRPVAPEYDFLMHVDDAHDGRQAVEDAVTDVGVVK
jgi:hypothetical protein